MINPRGILTAGLMVQGSARIIALLTAGLLGAAARNPSGIRFAALFTEAPMTLRFREQAVTLLFREEGSDKVFREQTPPDLAIRSAG